MTDYTQARAGDGKDGPEVDNWKHWHSDESMTREQVRMMAARRYLRNAGFESGNMDRPHVFTVWHWRDGDPTHPNGRPMTVHAITMTAYPSK